MRRRRRASGVLPRRPLGLLVLLLSSSLVAVAFVLHRPRLRISEPPPLPAASAAAAQNGDSEAAPPPLHLLPRHIAIIPDGNGRWAQDRGFPRVAGHREGAKRAIEILQACQELGGVKVWYGYGTCFDYSIDRSAL